MPTLQWTNLPAEIRLMILEALQNQGEFLAPYAQVSHEWRVFVERSTFRRLVLSAGDLDAFDALIAGRRTNVHSQVPIGYIWLRLVLPEYNCPDCRRPENSVEAATNDKIFTEAIWKLFRTLALLGTGCGLTLEFSAHSPSDSGHFFKSWYQLRPDYPHFATPHEHFTYVNGAKEYLPTDDKAHGYGKGNSRAKWIRSVGPGTRRQRAYAQRLVRPLKFDSTEYASLPKATCVADLLIRRQYFRDIETSSLSHILGSLPSLQRLRRENWRRVGVEERRNDEACYEFPPSLVFRNTVLREDLLPSFLTTSLPTSLTHLQLFQDFNAQLYGRADVRAPLFLSTSFLPDLARSTPNLQVFAVSFLADAIDIFGLRYCYLLEKRDGTIWDEATRQRRLDTETHYFSNMEYVALTSQEHLRPDQNRSKIHDFLCAAAAVASKMPKLKTMELWNCGQGQACIFRYEAVDYSDSELAHSCRLTWRSTWGLQDYAMGPTVLKTWEAVARARGYPSVLVERRPLLVGVSEREYTSHHELLRLGGLKLAHYELHDTSRAQASAEADMTPDAFMWSTGY
jgi:hypothetical protein